MDAETTENPTLNLASLSPIVNYNEVLAYKSDNIGNDIIRSKINEQLLDFRKQLKYFVKIILVMEIFFLMGLILLQGFKIHNFNLNDWFFGIFANGCLLQTFFLIKCIVSHVFPADPEKTGWREKP